MQPGKRQQVDPISRQDKHLKMKKTISVIAGALVALSFAACSGSGGYKKTRSGLQYKIISEGKGEVAKPGDFLKVHYTQRLNDSIMETSLGGLPTYARVDSVSGQQYSPAEIFGMLRKGDSAVIVMNPDSIYRQEGMRPPYVKKGDKLMLSFTVVDILADEMALRNDQQTIFEEQKVKEVKAIEQYLASKNIQAQKTEKGTFVQITEQGTGPMADSGKAVHVMYTGQTFDGKVFDSNIDTSFGHPDPYVLVIGARGAIEGWDDGLRLMRKGSKGRLYVPSLLAYGGNPPQGAPFKPFENLIFDVEVVDVTDAPRQQGGMPGAPPLR